MKKLSGIFLSHMLLVPYLCFGLSDGMLDMAKQAYIDGNYEESFERYSMFDFYCFGPGLENHINCFIGKTACEMKLGYTKSKYRWGLIIDLISADLDKQTSDMIFKGIENSLYYIVHDEMVK